MIYQISNLYYIKVASNVFKEVELRVDDNDLILVPTENKIEVYDTDKINVIYLQQEKQKLIDNVKKIDFNNSNNVRKNRYSK